jgi:hypothetical protein
MFTVTFKLPPEAAEALARPVVGQGGFQSLLRQLQSLLKDGDLTLTPELIAKMVRYVQDYGQGGFQGRLDTVLEELKKLSDVLRPLSDAS